MIPVSARNIDFVGSCDQGGRSDGVQVMVHKGHAYIGHMFSDGITVVDVADPRNPRTVNFVAAPPNTRCTHIQTHDEGQRSVRPGDVLQALAPERLAGRRFGEGQRVGRGLQVVGEEDGRMAVAGGVDADADASR